MKDFNPRSSDTNSRNPVMPAMRGRGRVLARSNSMSLGRGQWVTPNLTRTRTSGSIEDNDVPKTPNTPRSSKSRGQRAVNAMSKLLSRTISGKKSGFKGGAMATEPASPVSAQLSRTNSESSTQQEDADIGHAEEPRRRVSFDVQVTTTFIEQMDQEEVRDTFYSKSEYAAFKDAYRTHRDTSYNWSRSNDVLPCNCDACHDDLVEGGDRTSFPFPPAGENYDSDFDDSDGIPASRSTNGAEFAWHGAATSRESDTEEEEGCDPPPSPAGAVFQDIEESQTARSIAHRKTSPLHKLHASHKRRSTWGNAPNASAPRRVAHRRGASLDEVGMNANVKNVVRAHGSDYAYKTLRTQGFSDLYIRTHFLRDASSSINSRHQMFFEGT